MTKTKLLLMLVLLMTAATGAWARGGNTHRITATNGIETATKDVSLPYETTPRAVIKALTGIDPGEGFISVTKVEPSGTNIEVGTLNGWDTPVTVTAEGEATVTVTLNMGSVTFNISVTPIYTVSLKSGTKDADKWTATVGTSTTAQALPVGGLSEDDAVTLNYSGRLRVKKVTATTDAKPVSLDTPLTLKATSDGTIVVSNPKDGMQYSKNGATKTSDGIAEISVQKGDKVAFYGNGTSITSYNGTKITGGTATVRVYGNIMSLVDEEDFATATALTANNAFYELFRGNTKLTDVSGLLLPATTLTENCYNCMFGGCTGLTILPAKLLPATTLAKGCYNAMFIDCSNLTAVPADLLPATTLAEGCYNFMFSGCKGLTTLPADLLKATTLAKYCYSCMFSICKGLTTVPADFLKVETLAEGCYASMFSSCSSLTAAPKLPAPTLVTGCYYNMFRNCTSLNSVTCLATDISANDCTTDWLKKVAATGTFTKADAMTNWTTGNNGIPSGWTVEDAQ